jgi:hypothetical protein
MQNQRDRSRESCGSNFGGTIENRYKNRYSAPGAKPW